MTKILHTSHQPSQHLSALVIQPACLFLQLLLLFHNEQTTNKDFLYLMPSVFCSSRVHHSLALSVFMPIMHEGPCISFFGGMCTQFPQVNQIMACVENALEFRVNLPLPSLHGPYSIPCHSGKINMRPTPSPQAFTKATLLFMTDLFRGTCCLLLRCFKGSDTSGSQPFCPQWKCFVLFPLVHTPVLLST